MSRLTGNDGNSMASAGGGGRRSKGDLGQLGHDLTGLLRMGKLRHFSRLVNTHHPAADATHLGASAPPSSTLWEPSGQSGAGTAKLEF